MAAIAYMRVSTKDQSIARQKAVFKERGIHLDKIYDEPKSGKNLERPALKAMLAFIREGDTVYIESISRLARNTKDFLELVDIITNQKHAELVSLKESIDTTTPTGKFMLSVFAALYQLEREIILERQREGIAVALEQRKQGIDRPYGRPKAVCSKKFAKRYKQWKNGELTAREFMRLEGLKHTTFYKLVKEYENALVEP